MENEITAHKAGTIVELPISEGAAVKGGDPLAVIKRAIRVAGPEDVEVVARLLAEFRDHNGPRLAHAASRSEPGVERLINRDVSEHLLGVDPRDGRRAAPLPLRRRWDADDCCVEDVFVRAEARGIGVGGGLVDVAIERAASAAAAAGARHREDNARGAARSTDSLGFAARAGRVHAPADRETAASAVAPLASVDGHIVDRGVATAHVAEIDELPVLVAVRATPLRLGVAAVVLEADRDAVVRGTTTAPRSAGGRARAPACASRNWTIAVAAWKNRRGCATASRARTRRPPPLGIAARSRRLARSELVARGVAA